MADKLMRTAVVMSFFLILALFSSCGTNDTSLAKTDSGEQIALLQGELSTLIPESNPTNAIAQTLQIY